jgi:hypothetical protein
MNNFVINKDINQQNGDTDKKLQHGTRQLALTKALASLLLIPLVII